jgi:hypothetical protein
MRVLFLIVIVIVIVIVIADAVMRSAIAQDSVLTETSSGMAEIVRRIPNGMPIADAQRELEGWGVDCHAKLTRDCRLKLTRLCCV